MSEEGKNTCIGKLIPIMLVNHIWLLIIVFFLAFGISWKIMALGILPACIVAVVVTCVLAALVILMEYRIGRVSGDNEMTFYPDLKYLGVLPDSRNCSEVDREQNKAFKSICKRFQSTGVEHRVVMAGVLPGAKISDSFYNFLQFNYAMAGKKVLLLDIVDARDCNEILPMEDTCIVCYNDFLGIVPLENCNDLSPAELSLLKMDLSQLQKEYDLIIIRQKTPLTTILLLEDIASICDGMLIAVGAKRSKRKALRALSSFASKNNCQIMTALNLFSKIENRAIINMEI